jgi:AraC-like DNA-binding protein
MLVATDDPIEAIAHEVGYEDAGFFARLFRRNVDLTPGQYRRRFGAVRRALTANSALPTRRDAEPRTARA